MLTHKVGNIALGYIHRLCPLAVFYGSMITSKTQPNEVTVLRKIRDDLGLSQEGLAREIGCSLSTVQRAEAGEREPLLSVKQWKNFHKLLRKQKIKLPDRLSEKLPA